MNKNLSPIELANKLKDITGINVFENTRRQKVIEIRYLLCYLLREKLNMRWTRIADFFKENGKDLDHSTVIHAVKTYPYHKKANKELIELEGYFTFKQDLPIDQINRLSYLEDKYNKLEYMLENPLVKMVYKIPEKRHEEAIMHISNVIKSFEWKYNDKKIV